MKKIYHQLVQIFSNKNYKKFLNEMDSLREVQLNKLPCSYEEFVKNNPLTKYSNYKNDFEELVSNKKVKMVPTSGSTDQIKWIPYTKDFKDELAMASSPWLYDLYLRYPELKSGRHFWSLSWLPNNLRSKMSNDDLEVFSFFEKMVMKNIMALNESVSHAESLEVAMRKSALLLINKKITLISVWSPTFLIELLQLLFKEKEYFLQNAKSKSKKVLLKHNSLSADFCSEMFPKLKLISCWDSSQSVHFAKELKNLFPNIRFQGKGLWATEGVISIPFQDNLILAYQSHFYEFQDIETNEIVPSFNVLKNKKYKVILSTSSGLIRYQLEDIVEIEGFVKTIPIIKFIGRDKTYDFVGEKLTETDFQKIISDVERNFQISLTCFAISQKANPLRYEIILDSRFKNRELELKKFVENKLLEFFHYRLAREANQLDEVSLKFENNPMTTYLQLAGMKIEIVGNIKPSPIIVY